MKKKNQLAVLPKVLIKDPGKITKKHIDRICELIVEGNFDKTAYTLAGISEKAVWDLLNRAGPKKKELSVYATDSFKMAEAQKEQKMIGAILDPNSHPTAAKNVQTFLDATSTKFSKKLALHVHYEIDVLLGVLEQSLALEDYSMILEQLKDQDPFEIIAERDNQFLAAEGMGTKRQLLLEKKNKTTK